MSKQMVINAIPKTNEELVEQFQCPGCVAGSDTKCGSYKPSTNTLPCAGCDAHVIGTMVTTGMGLVSFALGLPKGFCRPGFNEENVDQPTPLSRMNIRLWTLDTSPEWNQFNIATWAMEQDGYLFVRTYSPRINRSFVDVIQGGTLALVPNAINVGEFYDDLD